MLRFTCFLCFLTLAAGCVLEDKPVDPANDGGVDGAVDAGMCGRCPLDQPVCTEDVQCVQCTVDDDKYCAARSLICDTDESTCVECLSNSDCPDADAAGCDAKECTRCDADVQCDDVDGLPSGNNTCDRGTCVDCTPETEAISCPDGDSCNPVTNNCSGIPEGDRQTCELCVSDRDCAEEGNRCVPMTYQGQPYPDVQTGFCLKTFSEGDPCEQPYFVPLPERASLSGPPTANYCGIDEANVTCPAVLAFLKNDECPSGDECPEGGLCRDFKDGVAENRCTYQCGDVLECKEPPVAGSTCGSAGTGNVDYCGG